MEIIQKYENTKKNALWWNLEDSLLCGSCFLCDVALFPPAARMDLSATLHHCWWWFVGCKQPHESSKVRFHCRCSSGWASECFSAVGSYVPPSPSSHDFCLKIWFLKRFLIYFLNMKTYPPDGVTLSGPCAHQNGKYEQRRGIITSITCGDSEYVFSESTNWSTSVNIASNVGIDDSIFVMISKNHSIFNINISSVHILFYQNHLELLKNDQLFYWATKIGYVYLNEAPRKPPGM